ncbi:SURF1 family protein [Candidatus Phycosocius spiralis]|uniref:SURF1-like protein n=1 Tax=Candidatus Phycosocius spiralis TaxID=2815099 RepID=A0ABQ4PWX6_9PROT|nr:SURF1 family protein [Candidatus Phycosocius spiralis]GIU67173.1 SURF1-like protein [Candidatus Phycosocius spiralis]
MSKQNTTTQKPIADPLSGQTGFKPMPALTVISILCLVLLYQLGHWQWVKFVEKSAAPAVSAAAKPVSIQAAFSSAPFEYQVVEAKGTLDPRVIGVRALHDGVSGRRLFSPMQSNGRWIFIDLGFVAEADLAKVPVVAGPRSYRGVLRKGAKANSFTPENDPTKQMWFWPDLAAMAGSLNLPADIAPFYIAISQVDPLNKGQLQANPWADPKGANQIPPERHLGYALTWWGFGFALIGVYTGLHLRTGRLRFVRRSL